MLTVAGGLAWLLISAVLALVIGRSIRLAETRDRRDPDGEQDASSGADGSDWPVQRG